MFRHGFRHGAVLAIMTLLAGCGRETVVAGEEPSNAYDGPMLLDVANPDSPSVAKRAGAAALALECDGEPYGGGTADYASGLSSVQSSAQSALENWLSEDWAGAIPSDGYRVEREDDGRMLLSFEVEGRSKVTVIAADGITDFDGHTGWGVETWAQCDPSELPERVTDDLGIQVWQNARGERVPTTRIQSHAGPEHCDWDNITFLTLDGGLQPSKDTQQFLRDTDGELGDYLTTTYAQVPRLPEDAEDTGFSRDGRRLWLGTTPAAAYLVDESDPDSIERWPATTQQIGCA